MASLDQGRASLEPTTTLVDTLTGGGSDTVTINGRQRHVVGYMRDFLFPPEQARTPIGRLSGGERGRLMLARALARPSNLMVLDEPTNDLDIETLDLLQELLGDYAGTILVVSHDRDFLDRSRDVGHCRRGRRPLGRVCRRLFRHGRPARPRSGRSARDACRAAGQANPPPADRAAPRRKLGFNERRALDTLPRRMEGLRADLDALEHKLAEADFAVREPASFLEATKSYAELRDALTAAEDEWLGLEILREELERQ